MHKEVRKVALETIKTLNDLNLAFMKNLFAKREVSKRNLEMLNQNATSKIQTKTLSYTEIRV